jgi:hypothetical protein
MKTINTLLAICFSLFSLHLTYAEGELPVFQKNTTFEQVCNKAQFLGKPVMLVISDKECSSMRNFTNKVLSDSTILGMYQKNFICYSIDAGSKEGKRLAYKYNALVLPTIIYFSPDRQIIYRSHATDQVTEAAEEVNKVMGVMKTHKLVQQQALKMRNISYLNRKVQKKVAISYAKKDAKEGRTETEKQAFEYTLNSEDLKHFKKFYIKEMNKYN